MKTGSAVAIGVILIIGIGTALFIMNAQASSDPSLVTFTVSGQLAAQDVASSKAAHDSLVNSTKTSAQQAVGQIFTSPPSQNIFQVTNWSQW